MARNVPANLAIEQQAGHALKACLLLVGLGLLALLLSRLPGSPDVSDAAPHTVHFSPPEGYYTQDVRLRLTPASDGKVLFTTDGSIPTPARATLYERPILLDTASKVSVIRARIRRPDGSLGPVTTASYFVGLEATLPLISLVTDPDNLWNTEDGLYYHPLARGRAWERPAEITFIDEDRHAGFHLPVGFRIHGYQSRAYVKKSFRLYFRSEYGAARLTYPLYAESDVTSFNRLVLHNGGQDWPMPPLIDWTLMRNELAGRLARDVGGIAPHSRPALLFLNGELWGIYRVRERPDEDFFADHFGMEDIDYLDSPHSYLEAIKQGDRTHWDALLTYVENHDLSDPDAYTHAAAQVDLDNLIDYFIIQMYTGNTDWPYHNVLQVRARTPAGRWQWLFWDTDNGFAAEGYSSLETNLVDYVLHARNPETQGHDTLLLRSLLTNAGFRQRFLLRASELLATTLGPENVVAHIDALAAELEPDAHYEAARWPTPGAWEAHVEELRAFARERHAVMRTQLVEGFNLDGAYTLELHPPAEGQGTLSVWQAPLETLPWTGVLFSGVPFEVTAVPAPGYRFARWEPELGSGATLTVTGPLSAPVTPHFERKAANEPSVGDVRIVNVHADDAGEIKGDWIDLRVVRGGIDLRGWRLTDNDTVAARDEGSLILPQIPALASVRRGTIVRIVSTRAAANDRRFPQDDLNALDGRLVLYVGNGALDARTDPGFHLTSGDNVALLTPGLSPAFTDDVGIDLVSDGVTTAASLGILEDGVRTRPWPQSEQASIP